MAALTSPAVAASTSEVYTKDQIARGAYLATAGDCAGCHTSKDHPAFTGGLPMNTPMGTIFSTNITPDKATGIGTYSATDFARALRQGVSPSGRNLYPAMPYPDYAKLTDSDVTAMYAYFMHGVTPVHRENTPTNIPWPLSMRWPLKLWNLFFTPRKPYVPVEAQSAEWNRGAYLVQSLGHCSACHTPRGVAFQEKAYDETGPLFLHGAPLDGWFASDITGNAKAGIGNWSIQEVRDFLRNGSNKYATAFGPMVTVINKSTQHMTDADLQAMAVYLKSLPGHDGTERTKTVPAANAESMRASMAHGQHIYDNYCASCHGANGQAAAPFIAPLVGNPNLRADDLLSLINVTLNGSEALHVDGQGSAYTMPQQGTALSNQDIADVLTYVRNSWGNDAGAVSAAAVAKLRTQSGVSQ